MMELNIWAREKQFSSSTDGFRTAWPLESRAKSISRSSQEMERAREVQERLFPRNLPKLETLTYAGVCIQSQHVGGDYYDFLDLGLGYMGLAVADASGKGVAAALLMASLQASLRSQCALAMDDLGSLLRAVNRQLCDNIPDSSFATMFFAEYSDDGRRLRYVNCGHPPALLMHSDGTLARLESTATVLGFSEDWDCTVGEEILSPGDTLLVYSDGATESLGEDGEEFGERHLVDLLRANRHLSPSSVAQSVVHALGRFSGPQFKDDVTVVVAREVAP
jgi:serine phosphatase RsbU (regulator of sigma subunit)